MLSAPAGMSNLVLDSPSDTDINGVAPEPDSTEDSTGGVDPSDLPQLLGRTETRRMSQPITGSPREPQDNDKTTSRRASEGSNQCPNVVAPPGSSEETEDRARMATNCRGAGADWGPDASSLSHIFVPTSSSGDACYLAMVANECRQHAGSSQRLKCVSCRIVTHEPCAPSLNARFTCRQSFCESVRKYREKTFVPHHWVQRKHLKGKCKSCGKAFSSKLGFSSSGREAVGLSCSWCKYSYHNKNSCLKVCEDDSTCDLGIHSKLIVPPTWIVKVPRKSSFKSSLKNSPNKNKNKKKAAMKAALADEDKSDQNDNEVDAKDEKPFCLKPIPSPGVAPILVFLNPKSGGNQGAKLMQKFQWLLNPRQVFDLTDGGPRPSIEMFKKVPHIKLLACGGDGTVGWLLSVLDRVTIEPAPAVGVLPLGTGNDLSRSLGWGGGYIDEPISKILSALQSADTLAMDRWQLKVERNNEYPSTESRGEDELPLNVVNNYFSLGVDAQIALQFHEAREANPQKFNSRIRNKMFYGQAGGKDLLLRKWKDLSDHITVECDGKDITPKLKEHRVHSVLFANIPSFGSGTRPWNRACGDQRMDDGLIEVIGLTTYQLPLLQAGGHGTCLAQCKSAKIQTRKTIPMQVDGEASRLNPANIELTFLNQVCMLAKTKSTLKSKPNSDDSADTSLKLGVSRIKMADYEAHHYNKDKIKCLAASFGEITTCISADLEHVRALIDKIQENNPSSVTGSGWCFVDAVTAGRFFRIDRGQENLHYVLDISDGNSLYILDEEEDEDLVAEEALLGATAMALEPDHHHQTPKLQESPNSRKESPPLKKESPSTRKESPPSKKELPKEEQKRSPKKISSPQKNIPEKIIEENEVEEKPSPKAVHHENRSPRPTTTQKALPDHGSNVLEKTTEGVLKAARLGDLRMLSELHAQGYSLLSIDETGKTALHYGARFGHKEVVRFLVDQAPPSILDMVDNEKGQTALHKAAAYKRRTICCLLIAAGASLLIPDHADLTPRQLAVMAEDHDLADYLDNQEQFQADKLAGDGDLNIETPV